MPPADAPPHADADPLLGRVFADHYRVTARLGRGSMGTVYRAHHDLLGKDFALKVVAADLVGDPEARRRFLVEARSLTTFAHRNAVQLRHCGDDDGVLYLVMDLAEGESLAALLEREGALAPPRAAELAVQLLGALEEAHAARIVHRDVKPANVVVETRPSPDGASADRARLLDFGLALLVAGEGPPAATPPPSTGLRVVGTVAYMAPEQVLAQPVDERADLFAVGAVLYELLTGERPFAGASPLATAAQVAGGAPRRWSARDLEAVPESLRAVVERALEKDPERRFQSAGQMAEAVRLALAGAPAAPSPRRQEAPAPPPSATRTRRRAWALATVGALAIVLLAMTMRRGADDPAQDAQARERAVTSLLEGRPAEALATLDALLARTPLDAEALLARGQARTMQADPGAWDDLERARGLLGPDARVAVARSRFLDEVEGDHARAVAELGHALWTHPETAEVRAQRARVALAANDLEAAASDVEALERSGGDAALALALRSQLERARATRGTESWDEAGMLRSVEAARRSVEADARWSGGPAALAVALQDAARAARAAGRYEDWRARIAEAVVAAGLALERAHAHPRHRSQGLDLVRLRMIRAGIQFVNGAHEASLADLDAALALAPRHAPALSGRAFALQQLGRSRAAIADYERLYDVTHGRDPLFRLAFGWQRLGEEAADRGEDDEAARALARAIETYGRGIARFPGAEEMPTYRGETHLLRARLRASGLDRAADLEAARRDLDAVLAAHPEDDAALLRRAELALEEGDEDAATARARASIAGRADRTARHYVTLARACLAVAERERDAGRPGPAATLVAEAVESLGRALAVQPSSSATARAWRAEAHLLALGLTGLPEERGAALEAAEADVRALEALAAEARAAGREEDALRALATAEHLRAGALLGRGDAAGAVAAARSAVTRREAERSAGRWALARAWYARLAEACAAAGDGPGAAAARARADALPR